jgi:hypothetical protein
MHSHLDYWVYWVAALVTTAVGAATSVVWAAGAPVVPPALHAGAYAAPVVVVPPVGNNANTPATTPVLPGQAYITPGFSAGQQAGTGGVPGTPSFTEGYGTTSPFASTAMTQPGQPPFLEGFSGNQGVGSSMTQPGVPDFYDGFGFNRGVTPPNQGAEPATPYPNYTTVPQPGNPGVANGGFGFYNGFGGGQPDVGFYAGFTTPR